MEKKSHQYAGSIQTQNDTTDIATGTADFALVALKLNPDHITGVDISQGMLEKGKEKIEKKGLTDKITLKYGDSEKLPFEDDSFDAITVAFGVRNYENLESGLLDMLRVLKPSGVAVILEFSKPKSFPAKQFFNLYNNKLLPLIGKPCLKTLEHTSIYPSPLKHSLKVMIFWKS